jgi:septum site-determining protein MinC
LTSPVALLRPPRRRPKTRRHSLDDFRLSQRQLSVHFATSRREFFQHNSNMMNKPANATREPALDIRFGQVGLVQVRIRTTDPGVILDELSGRIATAPRFFERTAVCLDLSGLQKSPDVAEIRGVIDAVKRAGMLSIGLTTGSLGVEELSGALQIPVLSHFRAQNHTVPVVQPVPVPQESAGLPALLHQQTVRSGQRVYARNRDLVVTAVVSAGAEVMADGCLHIYGALRGRAMAGAREDVTARVFCQEFHAELVSIAGVFRVFETIPPELAGKPVQAWLDGDKLHFGRIGG